MSGGVEIRDASREEGGEDGRRGQRRRSRRSRRSSRSSRSKRAGRSVPNLTRALACAVSPNKLSLLSFGTVRSSCHVTPCARAAASRVKAAHSMHCGGGPP